MNIADRKKYPEYNDSKILRELVLYMLIIFSGERSIPCEVFYHHFNFSSERTMYRYIRDLKASGKIGKACISESYIIADEEGAGPRYMPYALPMPAPAPLSANNRQHIVRLGRLCSIAKKIPIINPAYGEALKKKNYAFIDRTHCYIGTAAEVRQICRYNISKRTFERDIRLVSVALRTFIYLLRLKDSSRKT